MAEPEEKLLSDYFQTITTEAEQVPELKLDASIRSGMQRGSRTHVSLRKGYAVVLFAVVAITLFFIVPWANQITHPVRAQLPSKSWGELEVFRPIIDNNLTMKSALDAGLFKQIDISSAEVDGLQLTINGILADRRGIAVLYTIQNNTDQKMHSLGLSMKKSSEDIFDLRGYSGFSIFNGIDVGSPGTTRRIEQIVWDKYQNDLPEDLNITLRLIPESRLIQSSSLTPSSTNDSLSDVFKNLSIKIPMDVDKDYFEGEVVDLKENLSIAGQIIKMDNVYIGPTGIYMRESFDGKNTMRIFNILSSNLILGKGDSEEKLYLANGSSENGGLMTYIYHNDNMRFDDPPIKLEIEGITALDKSKIELVINTETREIIKAPDEFFSFAEEMDNEEQGVFSLELYIPIEKDPAHTGSFFLLDDNFVDSTGSGHWLERVYDNEGTGYKQISDSNGKTISATFNVGKEKLPQPLTFKFSSYPNVIMEKASLRIK